MVLSDAVLVHSIDIMRNKLPEMVYDLYNLPTQGVYREWKTGGVSTTTTRNNKKAPTIMLKKFQKTKKRW